ncbi:carbonic anhydrase 2 [Aplysia californica]|uniref:Carbonic anhydrase n=1 Tax=Aplysia californica TaxID=6500 RepID=A0ABM0JGL2_APLCA|nr:carbonic anhydrase 2 [Aplysia californica]
MLPVLLLVWTLLGLGSNPLATDSPQLCPLTKDHFDYDPRGSTVSSNWAAISSCCSSPVRQSPRDLDLSAIPTQYCSRPFSIQYHHSASQQGLLYNNGHAPNIDITTAYPAFLTGVPYAPDDKYVLVGIHFHFSNGSIGGSEHSLNGSKFDGEMHLVHYKEKYGSMANAVLKEDGLAVIGAFLVKSLEQIEPPKRPLDLLLEYFISLTGFGKAGGVNVALDVRALLPDRLDFYTYAGSLTTPSCSESVRWMVLADPLAVNPSSLDILRLLPMGADDDRLISLFSNVRDLQDNPQPVETNFPCWIQDVDSNPSSN